MTNGRDRLRDTFYLLLVTVVFWPVTLGWAAEDPPLKESQPIEIYTHGKRFSSLQEYHHYQDLLLNQQDNPLFQGSKDSPALMPDSVEELIVYLENLSDDEMQKVIKELRVRRAELFKQDPLDMYFQEMQMMLNQQQQVGNLEGIKLDPSRVRTITVSPKEKSGISLRDAKTMFITNNDIHSMSNRDINGLTESIKNRQGAPLSGEPSDGVAADIQAILIDDEYEELTPAIRAQTVLHQTSSQVASAPPSEKVVTAEEFREILQQMVHLKKTRPSVPGVNVLDPEVQELAKIFGPAEKQGYQPFSILMKPEEAKVLSKFLKTPDELEYSETVVTSKATAEEILKNLPDDELKQVLQIYNERRRGRVQEKMAKSLTRRNVGGLPVERVLKDEGGRLKPIVIDRNLPQFTPKGLDIEIEDVLDFKSLPIAEPKSP